MGWLKRSTGLDGFDLLIQAAVTLAVMTMANMEGEQQALPAIVAVSFVILGIRRHFALKKSASDPEGMTTGQMADLRLDEMEQRLGELDLANARITELEGRLDFAERLLARSSEELRIVSATGESREQGRLEEGRHG